MTRLRASDGGFERPSGIAEDAVVSVFRVPPEVAGQRLDVFLQSQLHRTSRTRTQVIVQNSAYDAAGRKLKPNERVKAEQKILLWRPPWDETPVSRDVKIVYEDEHLLAVDKPPNLPVHPTARYHNNTLIKIMHKARPGEWLSLGHRIDRETSGVLLLSKSPAADRALKKLLEQRDGIEKTYLAITWGAPSEDAATLRLERSMELDPESWCKVKMRLSDGPRALYAATGFTVLERKRTARDYALVRCDLETGRQHQIRLHLQSLGAPIVGDKLYGPDERMFARSADGELTAEDEVMLELPRHALHATRIALPHPVTGEALAIEAPLPEDLREFWDGLA